MEIEDYLENSEDFVRKIFTEDKWEKYINDIENIKQEIVKEKGSITDCFISWDSISPDEYFIYDYRDMYKHS